MAAKTRRKKGGKRKSTMRKGVGGAIDLIGEGGYGCIYHSSIPCVTYKEDGSIKREYDEDPRFVSKLTSGENGKKEMRENESISLIDMPDLKTGEGRFSIYPFRMCYLTKDIYSRPEIRKQVLGCEYRKMSGIKFNRNFKAEQIKDINSGEIEAVLAREAAETSGEELIRKKNELILRKLEENPKSIALLTMALGGKDLFDIIANSNVHTKMTENVPGKININTIIVLFMNIINGIDHYHQKHFYHLDLKPENIVYKAFEKEGKEYKYMKMIDFGLSTMLNTFDTGTHKYDLQMFNTRPLDLFLIQNPAFSKERFFNFPGLITTLKNMNGGIVPKTIGEVRGKITTIEDRNRLKKIVEYVDNVIEKYYMITEQAAAVSRHVLYTRTSMGERVPTITLNSMLATYHHYANKYTGDKSKYSLYTDEAAKREILEKVDVYGLSYFISLLIYGVFGYTMYNMVEIRGEDIRVVQHIVKYDRGSMRVLSDTEKKQAINKYLAMPLLELAVKGMDMSVEKRITLGEFRITYNNIIKEYVNEIYKPKLHTPKLHSLNSSSSDPDVIKAFLKKNKNIYSTLIGRFLKYKSNNNNEMSVISLPDEDFVSLQNEYNLNYENIMPKSKSYNNAKYYNENDIEKDPETGKFLTRLPSV